MSPDKIRYECGCGPNEPHLPMPDRGAGWFACQKCETPHYDPLVARRELRKLAEAEPLTEAEMEERMLQQSEDHVVELEAVAAEAEEDAEREVVETPEDEETPVILRDPPSQCIIEEPSLEGGHLAHEIQDLFKLIDKFCGVIKGRLGQKHLEGQHGWREMVMEEPKPDVAAPLGVALSDAVTKLTILPLTHHHSGTQEVIDQLTDVVAWAALYWRWLLLRQEKGISEQELADKLHEAGDAMNRIRMHREHGISLSHETIRKDLKKAIGKLLEIHQQGDE